MINSAKKEKITLNRPAANIVNMQSLINITAQENGNGNTQKSIVNEKKDNNVSCRHIAQS